MTTNPRRTNGHRRNTTRARVLARDERCWLCHLPVDKTIPTPHAQSPEVHELIPVSRGGSPYDINNCVLTHRTCNRWIGNRTAAEIKAFLSSGGPSRKAPSPRPLTSQSW